MNLRKINEFLEEAIGGLVDGELDEQIQVGQDVEYSNIRAHLYRGSLEVFNTTNAGKRGKSVQTFHIGNLDIADEKMQGLIREYLYKIGEKKFKDANEAFEAAQKLVSDCQEIAKDTSTKHWSTPNLSTGQSRGVDVRPAENPVIDVRGQHISVSAGPLDFHIRDLDDRNNDPTMIPPMKAARTAAKKFYDWALVNQDKLQSIRFSELSNEMSKLGIGSHYYCAMD